MIKITFKDKKKNKHDNSNIPVINTVDMKCAIYLQRSATAPDTIAEAMYAIIHWKPIVKTKNWIGLATFVPINLSPTPSP